MFHYAQFLHRCQHRQHQQRQQQQQQQQGRRQFYRLPAVSLWITFFLSSFVVDSTASRSITTRTDYFIGYLQDSCRCVAGNHLRCEPFTLPPLPPPYRGAGYLLLSRDPLFDAREFYCTYTLRAPPNMAVAVRVNSLQIPMPGHTCRAAVLRVFDGRSSNSTSDDFGRLLVGMCGSALPTETTFTSTSTELTLSYHQTPEIAHQPKSFNLTFTYFAVRKTGCLSTEFSYRSNSQCIDSSLLCDGVDNCFDASDESKEYEICGKLQPTSNPFIGTTVGVSMFLMAIASVVCLAATRARPSRQRTVRTMDTEAAAEALTGYSIDTVGPLSSSGTANASSAVNCSTTADSVASPMSGRRIQSVIAEHIDSLMTSSAVDPSVRHQTLIVVNGRHHVTVVAVPNPPTSGDVRATPPPAYDSLFPDEDSRTMPVT